MSGPLRSYTRPDGATVQVYYEDDAQDPRKDIDCLGKLWCLHRRYTLGDKHPFQESSFTSWDEFRACLEGDHGAVLTVPVYLYDHSGRKLSTEPFSCPWDSGQVGFIWCDQKTLDETWPDQIPEVALDNALACLKAEVKVYSSWIEGDVYLFETTMPDGSEGPSGGNYYGDDKDSGLLQDAGVEEASS